MLPSNNAINADSKKRRSFVAPLFTAGYGERWAAHKSRGEQCFNYVQTVSAATRTSRQSLLKRESVRLSAHSVLLVPRMCSVASAQTVVVSLCIALVAQQTNLPSIQRRPSVFINRPVATMQPNPRFQATSTLTRRRPRSGPLCIMKKSRAISRRKNGRSNTDRIPRLQSYG